MVVTVGHAGPLQQQHDAHLELRRCGGRWYKFSRPSPGESTRVVLRAYIGAMPFGTSGPLRLSWNCEPELGARVA
jgi:hypothetical protein